MPPRRCRGLSFAGWIIYREVQTRSSTGYGNPASANKFLTKILQYKRKETHANRMNGSIKGSCTVQTGLVIKGLINFFRNRFKDIINKEDQSHYKSRDVQIYNFFGF